MRKNLVSAGNKLRIEHYVIVVTAFLCITICSKSSPLYPFNNWDDANCFFTVGKAVVNHLVPYRDIFEQKGPLLYFIYSLSYLISHNTFFGIYLLELLSCMLFCTFSYKSVCLISNSEIISAIPISAAVIFCSDILASGASAEEFCLPLIAWSCYIGLKSITENRKMSRAEWFSVGLASGAVLWIKFSVLGFYIGFGLYFLGLYLKNKWVREILPSAVSLAAGIMAISIPILCYFIANGALRDLWGVYFYDNLFLYSIEKGGNPVVSAVINLFLGCGSFVKHFFIGIVFILMGFSWLLIRKNSKILLFLLATAAFSFLLIYVGGRRYVYYPLILAVYVPFGIILPKEIINPLAEKLLSGIKRTRFAAVLSTCALICLCSIAMYLLCPNTYMMKYRKEDLPQYKFDAIISSSDNPTLLNYGFLDGGFYTVSNIIPNCRYFCRLNIPLREMDEQQNTCLIDQSVKFVVTTFPLDEFFSDRYHCVCTADFEKTKDNIVTYYLYQATDRKPEKNWLG